jgi:hypothetical protein
MQIWNGFWKHCGTLHLTTTRAFVCQRLLKVVLLTLFNTQEKLCEVDWHYFVVLTGSGLNEAKALFLFFAIDSSFGVSKFDGVRYNVLQNLHEGWLCAELTNNCQRLLQCYWKTSLS